MLTLHITLAAVFSVGLHPSFDKAAHHFYIGRMWISASREF
jgi:hypothetical protein